MTVALWIVQGLLALMFLAAGFPKLTQPIPTLAKQLPWAESFPLPLVRFIGFAEIVGVLGLILPSVTKISPVLTPIASIGLGLIMLLSIGFHIQRNETNRIGLNIVILLLTIFVTIGRFAWAPISA